MSFPANGTCKSCGKKIVWIRTPEGKAIPLDPVPACYRITDGDDPDHVQGERDENVLVSHFVTCPNASQHSKTKGG